MLVLLHSLLAFTVLSVDAKDAAIIEFHKRVDQYLEIQKNAESSLPRDQKVGKKEKDPADIVQHQLALANAIRAMRTNAAAGDVFIPSVRPIFLSTIKRKLKGPAGRKARAMILGEGNPKNPESRAKVDLRVNATYPAKAPLSTVPPSVLLALPKLRDGLEYRFVGRHLILRDSKADLIVDVLENAIR